jgi:hypothetical protein
VVAGMDVGGDSVESVYGVLRSARWAQRFLDCPNQVSVNACDSVAQ